jgi:hypothetical protein
MRYAILTNPCLDAPFDVERLPELALRSTRFVDILKPIDIQFEYADVFQQSATSLTITVQPLATSLTGTVQPLATPLTITEGPSADDGDMLFDFDARQPVEPSRCFNIGDIVRVFEGIHAGVRGYKVIAYEGIIATFARDNYYEVRTVISQRREVRIVFVYDILPSTCAADEHDAKPKK